MNYGLRNYLTVSFSLSLSLSCHFLLLYSPSLSLSLQSHLTNQSTNHHPYLGRYLHVVGDFPPKTLLVVIIRGAAFSSQYAPKNSRLSWTSLRHRGRTAPYRVLGMFGKLWRAPAYAKPVPRGIFAFLFPLPFVVKGKMILPPVSGLSADNWRGVELRYMYVPYVDK